MVHDSDDDVHTSLDRSRRSGAWCDGNRYGDYVASMGRNDDYLELRLARGTFTGRRTASHYQRAGNLSIRRFEGGRGLAILRPTGSNRWGAREDGVWLGELVSLARPVLPHLRLDQDARPAESTVPPPVLEVNAPAPLASGRATLVEPPPLTLPMLSQAVAALERACLKEAERLGHLAVAADEEDASEFLDALRAIRRGSKLVRRWPRDSVARLALAQAFFLADAGPAAVGEASEALRLDPTLGEAHAVLGLEYLYQGHPDRARTAWEAASTLAPTGAWQETLAGALADERLAHREPTAPDAAASESGWRARVRRLLPRLKSIT